ncbi:MAG: hypothetical protein PHQ95_03875 [Candidatus Gracilibacteria bacterium]|nr:hypothetical protein [Candidatus Gracilibacteria bacterium]
MRIFSYILTALVTIFVLNIALSFSLPSYRNTLVNIRTSIFPSLSMPENEMEEQKKQENSRLLESLDRIDKHIESLNEIKNVRTEMITASGTINGETIFTDDTLSGALISAEEIVPQELTIPLSGLFLAKIMPEIILKKIDNNGFFDIQITKKMLYNTYRDEKKKITIYAFKDTYDTLLLNMKLANKIYSINETDQFFGYTFFLNLLKNDPKNTTVRFVTALEGQAIGVEVTREYYPILKKMLLKNK